MEIDTTQYAIQTTTGMHSIIRQVQTSAEVEEIVAHAMCDEETHTISIRKPIKTNLKFKDVTK